MPAAKCLLSLVVALAAAVCVVHGQERIKMCGRELIRLAVTTCGNSRLMRSIPDVDLGQIKFTPHRDHRVKETHLAPHLYPLPSRIRRATGRISDICCEKGCSMKELIQFC